MNKKTIKVLAVLFAAVMMALTVAGCRNDQETGFEPPEYIFVPEIIPVPELPEGVDQIDRIVVAGDTVFLSAWSFGGEGDRFSGSTLLAMNIDGTNLRELPNYDPGLPPPEAEGGNVSINNISVDRDGNLWVVEAGNFFYFDLPDDFVEDPEDEWGIWAYQRELGSFNAVRKLDSNGAEIMSIDISAIAAGSEWFWVRSLAIDGAGNVYIATDDSVDIMSPEGRPLFRLTMQGWIDTLFTLPDGTVASVGWGETGREMTLIDTTAGAWGSTVEMPQNVDTVFPGNDEFMFLYNTRTSLFGFDADTEESVLILNWLDSEVSPDGLGNIGFLEDGRLIVTTQTWRGEMQGPTVEMIFLTRARYEDLPERTLLTMATFWLDWNIRNEIVEFNRASTTHRIQVIDYGEYSTDDDWMAGLTRLTTEIIAGNVPDILDISQLPYQQYAARGLLMDLYTFIDADPELSRSDLMESAFRAVEIDGELPYIFPTFGIFTVIGNPAVLGPAPGWNMDEFNAVLSANPQADMPVGQWLTNESFLSMTFMLGMHNFVDWGAGTVNFDGGEFAALLETANTFPPTIGEMGGRDSFYDDSELIAAGRQIMQFQGLWDFHSIQSSMALFGGDIVYKGFPTENRDGNTLWTDSGLAITTASADPEGAWSFVRTFLTADWQRTNAQWAFPTNRAFFEERVHNELNPPPDMGESTVRWNGTFLTLDPLTQADIDQLNALIDSVSGTYGQDEALWNIILESASDFFNGQIPAEEAARIIQSRAAIYVSEQS